MSRLLHSCEYEEVDYMAFFLTVSLSGVQINWLSKHIPCTFRRHLGAKSGI